MPDLVSTIKFAYLKEMVKTGMRTEVDRLLFSGAGYKRAKNAKK